MRSLAMMLFSMIFSVAGLGFAQDAGDSTKPPKSPLSPEDSLKHLVLADPNLIIEIVAAEPEVVDPVSMQFDEHGRLWVVEMRDYPTGPQNAPPPLGGPDAKPLSRIKLLEDKDGDGRFETAHVFADNLLFATGVQPWDGGVIVTHSGEIVYLKDTDGDHKADLREVWFTGFSETNTQLRANHPTFGPDGWIYVANGLRGGNVIAVKKDWPLKLDNETRSQGEEEKGKTQSSSSLRLPLSPSPPLNPSGVSHDPGNPVPVSLTGRDFKFDPLSGRYEAISGNGQFGMTFDAWGNRFVCDNRHPCRHVIFEEDFIRRCPHVAFPAVVHDVIPPDDKNQVFPLTSAWTTSNLHAGTFTAACGVCVFTGDWPEDMFSRTSVFVCEPTGNLVQRAILEPDGVTFKSSNPHGRHENRDFLASRDEWFRPVDVQNGPDGALYVVDMYRAVIEHPEWVPDELKNRPDTWLGNDKGRIYRLRPKKQRKPQRDSTVTVANLRESLNSKNGWHRMTAARLRRENPESAFKLEPSSLENEFARCLAVQLEPDHIVANPSLALPLLLESERWTRARVVSLASHANWSEESRCGLIEIALWDPSPVVRLHGLTQLANAKCLLSNIHNVTTELLISDAGDPWLRLAHVAVRSLAEYSVEEGFLYPSVWLEWESKPKLWNEDGLPETAFLLGDVIGGLAKPPYEGVFNYFSSADQVYRGPEIKRIRIEMNVALGVAKGLSRRGIDLRRLAESTNRDIGQVIESAFADAYRLLAPSTTVLDDETRAAIVDTLRVLRYGNFQQHALGLKRIAESNEDQIIRQAAFETYASYHNAEVDAWLVERYRSETPAIRRATLLTLFASKERQLRLLEAVEKGAIAATELNLTQVHQLTQSKDETVRERAKTIFAAAAPASRKEVLEAYQPALTLKADPQRGREVFSRNCVTCHRVGDLGVNVAPDISDTRTKKPEQLLLDILDPNRAIDANYFAYSVTTKEGKVESGVIASESSNSITLKQPEGKTLTLLRSDIDELRNTGLSLMPVGVEKNINPQQMADLIFWLKNWRYLDGKVPATSLGK